MTVMTMETAENRPGSSDGGQSIKSRRGFFKVAAAILASLIGVVVGLPVLRSILPAATGGRDEWNKVSTLTSLSTNTPEKLKFPVLSEEAYLRRTRVHSIWAIKKPEGGITVFSPVCTHLGCYYTWNSEKDRFECPCHASVFSIDGTVLSGPAPRRLDKLPHKIENGALYIKWKEFKAGLPRKVEV